MSAPLRLLLQGCFLRGRPIVLYAAGRRGTRRDRAASWPSSLLPRRSSAGQSPVCERALQWHARYEPVVSGGGDGRFHSVRGPYRTGGGGRTAKSLGRVRDPLA